MNCSGPLKHWDRRFESRVRLGCLCVYSVYAALRLADPLSKESCRLCKRPRDGKSGKGPSKDYRAIDRYTSMLSGPVILCQVSGRVQWRTADKGLSSSSMVVCEVWNLLTAKETRILRNNRHGHERGKWKYPHYLKPGVSEVPVSQVHWKRNRLICWLDLQLLLLVDALC
jgi:hypothetical protein